jgi:hypothetical protein
LESAKKQSILIIQTTEINTKSQANLSINIILIQTLKHMENLLVKIAENLEKHSHMCISDGEKDQHKIKYDIGANEHRESLVNLFLLTQERQVLIFFQRGTGSLCHIHDVACVFIDCANS